MDRRTKTPIVRAARPSLAPSPRSPDPSIDYESISSMPAPPPGPTIEPIESEDEDERAAGWFESKVPAPMRTAGRAADRAADRIQDISVRVLGLNSFASVGMANGIVYFCIAYTVLHGFFGFSWCFGQAGHYREPDLSPPQHPEMPGPFSHAPKGDP